ncbi:MAG: GFA family protein [bacterium]
MSCGQLQSQQGGCLCGGVRYRVTGELRDVINCFCSQCRKTSGHHVAATSVANTKFELLNQDTLKWYQSSQQARRGFCGDCGSNLFWQRDDAVTISIMAGTLEAPTGLATVQNIFLEDMSDYHEIPALSGHDATN